MCRKQRFPWRSIDNYDELSPGRKFPSMRDSFSPEPYLGQAYVAAYLRSGTDYMVSVALPRDVLNGQRFAGETMAMHDEKYCWSSDLAYYVEHYNLRLPLEIEQHILRSKIE